MAAAAAGYYGVDPFVGKTSFTRNFSYTVEGIDTVFINNLNEILQQFYPGFYGAVSVPTPLGFQTKVGYPAGVKKDGLGVYIEVSAAGFAGRAEGVVRSIFSSKPSTTLNRTITVTKNTITPGRDDALKIVNDAITAAYTKTIADYPGSMNLADTDELKGGARRSRRRRSTRRHRHRRSTRRHRRHH
jgi:hypothetical protein